MKNSIQLVILFTFFYLFVGAQSTDLAGNDVSARINTNGVLFMKTGVLNAGYEIPKNSGLNAIFAASLWCSAVDANGGLRLAAMRFGQQGADFFEGPYSLTNDYTNSSYVSTYGNSIWQITAFEIQNHITNYTSSGYIVPTAIASWPGNGISGAGVAQNLAPFIDLNNNGIYEPSLGDYPDIRGDIAVYTIMNDAAGLHTETDGDKMEIEVHTMAYQYLTNDYRNRTTYLHYRVFNRGTLGYSNFKLGMWWDPDLGNPQDDYVGCDTLTNMMYVYNADNNDELSSSGPGYGLNPPALGISSLTKKMEYFTYFTNGASFPYTDPLSAPGYYNFMNGLWANGTQMYYGGTGSPSSPGSTTIPTNYLFPGNPNIPYEWSESDTVYGVNQPGDRRGVMTLEAESLPSGAFSCYDFAVLYAREPGNNVTNHKTNVNALKNIAAIAKTDFDAEWTYNCNLYTTLGTEKLEESSIGLYPNPSDGQFTLAFDETLSGELLITDMTGRSVYHENFYNQNQIQVQLSEKTGIYLLSLSTAKGTIIKKISIQE
tara:strand:+ start:17507 stop:19132 length:1626 start_codon:yes stop_codon:yes gene_type:complete